MRPIVTPAKGMNINPYPKGNVYQGHSENIDLYRNAINIPKCGLSDCKMNGHNGIDIAMAEGTPICATEGLVVEVKDTPTGYGKHIRILTDPDENGDRWELTYGHLKDIYTALGMRVKDEQVIGAMGNTGFVISGSTAYWGNAPAGKGVHLHLTARPACDNRTDWMTTYATGQNVYLKEYNNGTFGSIDPLPYIREYIENQIKAKQNILILILKQFLGLLTKGR